MLARGGRQRADEELRLQPPTRPDPRAPEATCARPSRCSPASGPTCPSRRSAGWPPDWGYDGLEIACWGDHFEVDKALGRRRLRAEAARRLLDKHGLKCLGDLQPPGRPGRVRPPHRRAAPRRILPARIWGDGDAGGVRQRAAEEIKDTARAAARLGVDTVVGFTGSSIWHTVAMFPPVPAVDDRRAATQDFADRWNPILDVFDEVGVRFAHEVHPSEIAYDYWTTVRTLEAIGHRPAFGLNWDPSHFVVAGPRPGRLPPRTSPTAIYHVDCKDARKRLRRPQRAAGLPPAVGRPAARLGLRLRPATATCPGRTASGRSTRIGYDGPISIEWEDAGMDRLAGRARGAEFARQAGRFEPPSASFDCRAAADPRAPRRSGTGPEQPPAPRSGCPNP